MDKIDFKFLSWDSHFFQKKIGQIRIKNNLFNDKYINDLLKDVNIDICYIVSDSKIDNYSLKNYTCSLSKSTLVFRKEKLMDCNVDKTEIIKYNHNLHSKMYPELLDLAFLSGHKSRFKDDCKFERQSYKKLYKAWIDNTISNKFGDGINMLLVNGSVAGMVTYQSDSYVAKIGLIAVHEKFQGKGIGHKLVHSFEKNYKDQDNIKVFEISTQGDNLAASKLYEKNDYSLHKRNYIYHYWRT